MLDRSVIVFIDDILVYSKSREQHEEHLRATRGFATRTVVCQVLEMRVLVTGGPVPRAPR